MKKLSGMKMIAMLVSCVLMLLAGGCASDLSEAAKSEEMTENGSFWRGKLQEYREDESVRHLLFVRYTGGSDALIQYFEKNSEESNAWSLVFEEEGFVGKNGIDKTKEGDTKAPTGDFGILNAFGIRRNPGTVFDYIQVTPEIFACDEEGPYYNTIVNTAETGHKCKGEEMFKLSPEYNYGLATDFNKECAAGAGSAIFIHCKGAKIYTGGCVALSEDNMRTVLETADPGLRVIIDRD